MKRAVIAAIVLIIGGVACSASKNAATPRAAGSPAPADQAAEGVFNGTAQVYRNSVTTGSVAGHGSAKVPAAPPEPGSSLPPLPDRIVKNADLNLQVGKGSFD